MSHSSIDTALYWSLPGPRALFTRVAEAAVISRAFWINLPHIPVRGTWEKIKEGLRSANIATPIDLTIRAGTDIGAEIGVHVHERRITAAQLAMHVAQIRTAVILRAEDDLAKRECDAYALEFMAALSTAGQQGNMQLVIALHDESFTDDRHDNGLQVIAFDGSLTFDEIDAYVAIRMLDSPGPGSTRLLRRIVSEFAGFDVEMAERLMAMPEAQLLLINEHLADLMAVDIDRWRHKSWLHRTMTTHSPGATHVLWDMFKTLHGTPGEAAEAETRIKKRYWRACVRTITPWLEERRAQVVGCFSSQLKLIAANHGGKFPRPINDGRKLYMGEEELEFNNIVGMVRFKSLNLVTAREERAFSICLLAKRVRDDLAHLRMPQPHILNQLVAEMDSEFPNFGNA